MADIAGGDNVEVKVTKVTDRSSEVYVVVSATADAMDMGRSARVVRTLYRYLDNVVKQKQSAAADPQ